MRPVEDTMATSQRIRRLTRSPLLLIGLLAATLVVAFDRSIQRAPDTAEELAVARAETILAGETTGSAHDHLLAAAIAVGGAERSDSACRALHFAFFALILLAVFVLATEVFDPRSGLAATVLLASSAVFVDEVVRVRPEIPQALLGLIAVWAFLRHGRDRRPRHLVLGALAAGMSLVFAECAVPLVLALALAALLRVGFGRMTWGELGIAVSVLALMSLPSLGWSFEAGRAFAGLGAPGASPAAWLSENLRHGLFLWTFFCIGLLLFLERERELELGVIVLSVLAAVWAVRSPGDAVFALPLVAIVAGRGLVRAFEGRRHLAHALLIASALPGLYHLAAASRAEAPSAPPAGIARIVDAG
jgi:hypothetical protein